MLPLVMAHVLTQGLHTLRLGSARAVAVAWVVLALAAALVLGAALVAHTPAGATAVQAQCDLGTGGVDCSGPASR